MKAVLISIQPYWVFLIIAKAMGWDIQREKTLEIRKDYPKDREWNRLTHIYCSKDRKSFNRIPKRYQPFMEKLLGKVVGYFVCDRIEDFSKWEFDYSSLLRHINLYAGTNSDYKFLDDYLKGQKQGYAWHISDLKIYDKPKELREFRKPCPNWYMSCSICPSCDKDENDNLIQCFNKVSRPPQSWCYVEDL